jgi:hypothetical protein
LSVTSIEVGARRKDLEAVAAGGKLNRLLQRHASGHAKSRVSKKYIPRTPK